MDIQNNLSNDGSKMDDILSKFPAIQFAFAYGSGVVEQAGYNYTVKKSSTVPLPMIDMVFAVDNPEEWHHKNLILNPDHYTPLLPFIGSSVIACIQDSIGAGYWYNAMVPINRHDPQGRQMKYGVVSRKRLLHDLLKWTDLYGAGRLHKPVKILVSDIEIEAAIAINREHAVRTALLLMPQTFTETDMYVKIASLSYLGDPRIAVGGENPNKVNNLVMPKIPLYRDIYKNILSKLSRKANVQMLSEERHYYSQDVSFAARWNLLLGLPLSMREMLLIQGRRRFPASLSPPSRVAIKEALSKIVSRASGTQSVKGMFTIGAIKTTSYLISKFSKRFSI